MIGQSMISLSAEQIDLRITEVLWFAFCLSHLD